MVKEFLAVTSVLSLLQSVHDGYGVHPAAYSMDTEGRFSGVGERGVNRSRYEADH